MSSGNPSSGSSASPSGIGCHLSFTFDVQIGAGRVPCNVELRFLRLEPQVLRVLSLVLLLLKLELRLSLSSSGSVTFPRVRRLDLGCEQCRRHLGPSIGVNST